MKTISLLYYLIILIELYVVFSVLLFYAIPKSAKLNRAHAIYGYGVVALK